MTPEEKAVVEAAIAERNSLWNLFATGKDSPLVAAIDALIDLRTDQSDRDAAETAILAGELSASTFPCWECLTDPTEDPITWCDDRPEDFGTQNPNHPCRLRAHAPEKCLNRPADPDPVWIETAMGNALINDEIRMGSERATVLRSNRGIWNADTRNSWEPKAWKHEEFRAELQGPTAPPGFQQYPAAASIEILCTPERLAVLRIQEGFPGGAPISSHVD